MAQRRDRPAPYRARRHSAVTRPCFGVVGRLFLQSGDEGAGNASTSRMTGANERREHQPLNPRQRRPIPEWVRLATRPESTKGRSDRENRPGLDSRSPRREILFFGHAADQLDVVLEYAGHHLL
jgi:hypothetical protein